MRKQPAQERSKVTVAAIVEAAARILSDRGWVGFTTNKVADAAGVSIGSYYQYFPDKHALIEAVRARHLEDCRTVLQDAARKDKPRCVFVAELVDDIVAIHSVHPGLHRILLDEAPASGAFRDPASAFEQAYLGCYSAIAARYRSGGTGGTDEMMGTVLSDAIDGVVHNAARRGTLQTAEVRGELVRLVTSYLGSSDPPA